MRLLLPKSCLVKLLQHTEHPIALLGSAVTSSLVVRLKLCHLT